MNKSNPKKLGAFLREVSNWDWEQFCRAEHDPTYTTNQSLIFSLVRSCAMEKMDAIKIALNRLDGKLKTPVHVELPKVFYLYPNATTPEPKEGRSQLEAAPIPFEEVPIIATGEVVEYDPLEDAEKPETRDDLLELTLRQTLNRMTDHARQIPAAIIEFAIATQQWLNHPDKNPEPIEKPLVKSVIAAHMLHMAQHRDIDALTEVFDQVDGKLVETIQILGEDIYITDYSLSAPDGAYLNKNGVLEMEAVQAQQLWAQKLDKTIS